MITGCQNTTIPNNVQTIYYNAFEGCTNLTSIDIPESVTKIHERAFAGCINLRSIYIPMSVRTIENYAFINNENLIVYCETQSKPIYWEPMWREGTKAVVWGYTKQ